MYTETITQRLALANGIPPQVLNNARLSSDGIDMQKSHRALFVLSIGAVTGGGSISAWLQESADNSTWTDVAGATFTAVTASNNVQTITFERTKRYLRHSRTASGTSPAFVLGVLIGEQKKAV